MWSYAIALGHFFSELLVWKTTNFVPGIVSPFIVASTSLFFLLLVLLETSASLLSTRAGLTTAPGSSLAAMWLQHDAYSG